MEIPTQELEMSYRELMQRIAPEFPRSSGIANAEKYKKGLLSPIERKNGWQIAEAVGETTPYALQQFLYRGQFNADNLRNHLRDYVNEKLGETDGVLVVDESGFLKQGKMSVGVKRQYSGTGRELPNRRIPFIRECKRARGYRPPVVYTRRLVPNSRALPQGGRS